MDFEELTNYGLSDTGAITMAISEAELRKFSC